MLIGWMFGRFHWEFHQVIAFCGLLRRMWYPLGKCLGSRLYEWKGSKWVNWVREFGEVS